MVKELDYAFAVARIRANERYMLSASDVEALIMAENVEKAVSFLYTKKWFDLPLQSSIKDICENAQKKLWILLTESVPDKSELEIFTVPPVSNPISPCFIAFSTRGCTVSAGIRK